jgi:beta-lactamase class A
MFLTATPDRRRFLSASGAALLFGGAAGTRDGLAEAVRALADIEARIGGRVGVAALHTGAGAWIRHRAGERFAMCSSFKCLLAGHALALADTGRLRLDQRVAFTRADLLPHAPRTQARVGEGSMPLEDLCAAAVEVSDNTAANLILDLTGGPAGLTAWLRSIGDPVTRLDRMELDLNTNIAGDQRDTTTPEAFALTIRRLLLGGVLSRASRDRLTDWMVHCETGLARLRAGAPTDWKVADKTGTGDFGAVVDVAALWPPDRPPILIASMLSDSSKPVEQLEAAHASIARAVIAAFG